MIARPVRRSRSCASCTRWRMRDSSSACSERMSRPMEVSEAFSAAMRPVTRGQSGVATSRSLKTLSASLA